MFSLIKTYEEDPCWAAFIYEWLHVWWFLSYQFSIWYIKYCISIPYSYDTKTWLQYITAKNRSNFKTNWRLPFPILQFYVLFHVNFLWLVYVPVCVNQWTSVVQDPVHSIPEPLNEWPLVTDIWERNIRQSFWNQLKKSYKLCLYKAIIAVCKQSKTKKQPQRNSGSDVTS